MPSIHGRRLCGRVRFTCAPAGVTRRGHCHCETCRRATSSPFTTFCGVRNSASRSTGSAPGARRCFCATCGSQMARATVHRAEETDFRAACLDDPADFAPDGHRHFAGKLPWIHLNDDLPRHSAASRDDSD